MSTPDEAARDGHLAVYLALSSPTRVAIIDALKVKVGLSVKELGEWLVATGDLAPQARPNLTRVHLTQLEEVKLIEKFIDVDNEARYRLGPALGAGVSWAQVDPKDEELAGAAEEFARVLTERRIMRMRVFEAMRWASESDPWRRAATTTDNVENYTIEELEWAGDRIQEVLDELGERVKERHERNPGAAERPCFRTVNIFPWGPPDIGNAE